MKVLNPKYKSVALAMGSLIALFLVSCEDYLDRSPESSIDDSAIFTNFYTFQGFIEEMYGCIVDYNKATELWSRYLFADETVWTGGPYSEDIGNYWDQSNLLYGNFVVVVDDNSHSRRIWPHAWYGIRKANLALEKISLFKGSDAERKLLEGQAYFFRGWFHFELARFWGGLPYVDKYLSANEEFNLPRLTFQETAIKCAEDFAKAAELLPVNWNEWASQCNFQTNENRRRISKVYALSYQGKALLYAGSPMPNEEAGNGNVFNAELCKKSADALGAALKTCDETGMYKLQSWDTWTDNFWVWSQSVWGGFVEVPGGTEVIMSPPVYRAGDVPWNACAGTVPIQFGLNSPHVEVPTVNMVDAYAMANGLPIDDPESGYDPNDPWTNREPRFYKDIIKDGDKMVENTVNSVAKENEFAQLFTAGKHRGNDGMRGSETGFYYKRYTPIGVNRWDNRFEAFQAYIPYLRLADVYLMYSEATLHGYGLGATANGYSMTAVQALEVERARATLPPLPARHTNTREALMESIIKERCVELAFEAARHHDLRRWNISGDEKYLNKYALFFDRGPDGKPVNIEKRVYIRRVFQKKHNWWPFQTNFTKLYPGFQQNPGW